MFKVNNKNIRTSKVFLIVKNILWSLSILPENVSSENQMFSDDFRGYRSRPVAWNRLTYFFNEAGQIHATFYNQHSNSGILS